MFSDSVLRIIFLCAIIKSLGLESEADHTHLGRGWGSSKKAQKSRDDVLLGWVFGGWVLLVVLI